MYSPVLETQTTVPISEVYGRPTRLPRMSQIVDPLGNVPVVGLRLKSPYIKAILKAPVAGKPLEDGKAALRKKYGIVPKKK